MDNDLENSANEEPIAKQDKNPKSRFIDGLFKSLRGHPEDLQYFSYQLENLAGEQVS